MKNLLITIALISTISSASAIEILSYKSTASSKIAKMSEASLDKIWTSATPACIKDGAKLLGVNKAFKEKSLGYRDCSTSDKALEKQRMLGFSVVKIDFTSLPIKTAKQILGYN